MLSWVIFQHRNTVEHESIQSGFNVCFSSNHRPSEGSSTRFTHNDPIMSPVPLTQDKCASRELIGRSEYQKRGLTVHRKYFSECGWWNLRKAEIYSKEKKSTAESVAHSQHFTSRTRSKCGQTLVQDVTLSATDTTHTGLSKHRLVQRGVYKQIRLI